MVKGVASKRPPPSTSRSTATTTSLAPPFYINRCCRPVRASDSPPASRLLQPPCISSASHLLSLHQSSVATVHKLLFSLLSSRVSAMWVQIWWIAASSVVASTWGSLDSWLLVEIFAFLDNLGYPPHSWIGFYFTIKFKW